MFKLDRSQKEIQKAADLGFTGLKEEAPYLQEPMRSRRALQQN